MCLENVMRFKKDFTHIQTLKKKMYMLKLFFIPSNTVKKILAVNISRL